MAPQKVSVEFCRWLQNYMEQLLSEEDVNSFIVEAHMQAEVEKAIAPVKRQHSKVFKAAAGAKDND